MRGSLEVGSWAIPIEPYSLNPSLIQIQNRNKIRKKMEIDETNLDHRNIRYQTFSRFRKAFLQVFT